LSGVTVDTGIELPAVAPGARESLQFPDVPKLELDQLIDQLIERAQDVKRTQGRLRTLLTAIETITSDLSLDMVLRNIVAAGCELASARFGALGVIGADGMLEQFIHVGIDEPTAKRIGALPQGKGLLGALITDPRPIRLAKLSGDDRSSGFPPNHPPMNSFLGVPITVRDAVFGNLYLTESTSGEFSAEDQQLVVALAMAAGAAISNARLYHESQMQQRWHSASAEISSHLLAASGEDPLRTIARHAFAVADADVVSLSLLTPDRRSLIIEAAFGLSADQLIGQRLPVEGSLAGRAIKNHAALLAVDGQLDGQRFVQFGDAVEPGPTMIVPLPGKDSVRGVLSLARRRGRRAFTASELAMADGFANHASLALELAASREAEQKIVLLEDRDRIARDLHDHVIQELFAIGLSLESVAASLDPSSRLGERVQQRVEDIDRTIRRIRTSIFALRGPLDGLAGGARQAVMEVTSDLTATLGFPPHVSFAGQLDFATDPILVDDITAVVRETLTNVAKHAGASQVSVDVTLAAGELTVTVTDDGTGVRDTGRSSGTANLRARAERRGGTFTLAPANAGGTIAIWKVRVP
jgi:signal transduction histidine kinase